MDKNSTNKNLIKRLEAYNKSLNKNKLNDKMQKRLKEYNNQFKK